MFAVITITGRAPPLIHSLCDAALYGGSSCAGHRCARLGLGGGNWGEWVVPPLFLLLPWNRKAVPSCRASAGLLGAYTQGRMTPASSRTLPGTEETDMSFKSLECQGFHDRSYWSFIVLRDPQGKELFLIYLCNARALTECLAFCRHSGNAWKWIKMIHIYLWHMAHMRTLFLAYFFLCCYVTEYLRLS